MSVTPTLYPNAENMTTVIDLVKYDNIVTGNLFIPVLTFVIFVIIFRATADFPKQVSFTLASFSCFIFSTLFFLLDVGGTNLIILTLFGTVVGAYFLITK